MAFGIDKIKTEQPKVISDEEAAIREENDFLKPTADAKKDSQNDPYREEVTYKTAFQTTMKTLNALKIVSPIISALMQRPGVEAKNEDLSESFRTLITEISSLAENVCKQLNVDPTKEKNFWIRNVLERNFSQVLGEQWIKNGKVDVSPVREMIESVIEFSENVAEKEKYNEISDIHLVKLAGITAMLPILKEATNFNLYRNFENDIEGIMLKLKSKAVEATKELADPYANSDERSKLYYLLLKEAGEMYAISWKIETQRIHNIMNSFSEEKLRSSITQYKENGGFPLNKVDIEFDKYFSKVVTISKKLVASQTGTIKTRLVKK